MNKNYGLFDGRPALSSLIVYTLGILIAGYLPFHSTIYMAVTLSIAIAALVYHLKNYSKFSTVLLYFSLIFAGITAYQISVSDFPPTHIKNIVEKASTVTIIGEIVAEPDIRSDRTYMIIEVDSLIWRKRKFKSCGNIMLKINHQSKSYLFKDRLRFNGYLFKPGGAHIPGGFDYERWLRHKGVFGMMVLNDTSVIRILPGQPQRWYEYLMFWNLERVFINKLVSPLREILLAGYELYLPENQASLLAGFVLGEKRDMPDDIVSLFRDTGTLHLMAVSGSNVAIIVMFFLAITYPLKRRIRIIITLIAVVFFCFLTRNEPSVVRASVMASIGLIGYYRKPDPDIIGLLAFSGLILLITSPLWIFSIGFQLSFAACGGIVYLMPKVIALFTRKKGLWARAIDYILFTFFTTLSAQIAVLPLTAQYFNRIPIVGVIANIPMVLLASILTIAGICFLPFILMGDFFTSVYVWPLSKLISIILPLLGFFVDLPYSVVDVSSPGWGTIILFYTGLYLIVELSFHRRLSLKASIITLSAISIVIWISYLYNPLEDSITFVDCGDDRAVLFCTSSGERYLWYDIYNNDDIDHLENSLKPFLFKTGIRKIDTLFTNNKNDLSILTESINVGDIIEHESLIVDTSILDIVFPQYTSAESILNKKVKLVTVETDNNSETVTDGYYYKLSTSGGECILAGSVNPRYAGDIDHKAKVMELPWSVQPYGTVYKSILRNAPDMLVFSPDRNTESSVGTKDKLTYYDDRTWSVKFNGSFRIRFSDKMHVDFMLKP